MTVETRYAKTGDIHIAYQVVGDGPVDIVLAAEFWHSIEVQWDQPDLAAFLERLAAVGRLICFDQRGSGVSDPVSLRELRSLELWMDDIHVVMDEVQSENAVLYGIGGGGTMSMLFAATYPQRVSGLILVNSFARLSRAPDYPWGRGPELEDEVLDVMRTGWGRGVFLDLVAPSRVGDEAFRQWWARYQRVGASPGTVLSMRQMLAEIDVRDVLPSIRAPTLILHRAGTTWNRVEHGRYLAEHIPGAKYVELPGVDHFSFIGDSEAVLREVEQFVAGIAGPPESDRQLSTVLFTDIVGSTKLAAEIGDRRWSEVLEAQRALVRRELERYRGREVDTAGDGFFATFDGPARAVRCARVLRDSVRPLGIEIRAGLHTGEVEVLKEGLAGVAVHIGQRVLAEASPGEVLVSSTVKDLTAGSGLEFDDRGLHALKGVPDEWRLFAVR
ncbi:MAG TPA: adenylate/guanylate cyclase domain-containing protein [Gaiellaceae bacterium]|nr:adenylate/guanylate cyclase domain-containing protein [Gaiellaceae bacterium]